jgi:metallo-beta-lactamase family protein
MKLVFHGAAGEVTGSCFLIEAGGSRLLVDCGLIQGGPRDERRNREPLPFDPASIDAVVLTHAHLDHSGRLPLLVSQGYRGPIYTHGATADLCRIMLRDAAYLNEKDAEWENRKRERKGLERVDPLYTQRAAARAVRRFQPLDYGATRALTPGISVRLRDAGHILGSAVVEVWLEEHGLRRKVVFSGDLGHRGAPVLRDPELVDEADLVVLESTYGDRQHRSWAATWSELGQVLKDVAGGRGNLLVPAFTIGRTQELLYVFREHFEDWEVDRWQVVLDSPMAIEATDVYARHFDVYDSEAARARRDGASPFDLPNLYISRTARQSMALNRIRSGAMIIAGSGMCDGGRIKHHLKHQVWRPETHVLIVGYQAAGTIGRSLVDGARYIRLWGETVRVAATVHTIGGLSAHADQNGLVDWYRGFKARPPVALVHGEPEPRATLAGRLGEELGATVYSPRPGEKIDLSKLR